MQQNRITTYLAGGLGNQLFQYSAALSRKPDVLVLDCISGSPRLNQESMPAILDFEILNELKGRESTTLLSKDSRITKSFLRRFTWFLIRIGAEPTKIERTLLFPFFIPSLANLVFSILLGRFTKVVLARDIGYWSMPKRVGNEYLIGYHQSYVWPMDHFVFDRVKRLKLKNPSSEFSTFCELTFNCDVVGVHVRLGDYKSLDDFGIPDLEYYSKALKAINADRQIEKILLFSDEPEEALNFIPIEYLNRVQVAPSFKGSAAETLEAMRHCSAFVIANSTLSWWGALLSYSPNPFVVAPQPWFRRKDEPKSLVPPDWIRIEAWTSEN